jgi:L-ascorbate metabolism protein UlaG (beta-lactamase superfamily)
MSDDVLYLRPDIQVEPLVDQWYAWPHLISPATAARNVCERHLKIMDSYISAPQIHANAVKNPKLLGGPFIDYRGERVDEIRALRDRIKSERSALIAFSKALDELDALLLKNAKGYSLHPLYEAVPDILRGYVELVYDLNNQPSYRVLESLLYRSQYYVESAQSVMLRVTKGDDRPFVLSTPRLKSDDCVHLHMPFRAEQLDTLFSWKIEPVTWRKVLEVLEVLDVPSQSADLLRSFFTTEPPKSYRPYRGNGIRWRYFGHACILIETKNISILVDPVLSYTYDSQISRYTYKDLPDSIDYVLITHNHQDHILLETLLQLRHKIRHIVLPRSSGGPLQDPSLKLMFKQLRFENVLELGELERLDIPAGFIMGLPFIGEHSDLAVSTKLAHLVHIDGHSLLFAADSCNIEPRLYRHLHGIIGDVEVLFLGMECDGAPLSWLYGPLMTRRIERAMDESRRLSGSNYDQAMGIVEEFAFKEVYVYAMGQEPWLNFVMSLKYTNESRPIVESNRLINECLRRGLHAERLFGEKEIFIEQPQFA